MSNAAEVARLRSIGRDLSGGHFGPVLPDLGAFFDCVADLVWETGAVLDVDLVRVEREIGEGLEDHL